MLGRKLSLKETATIVYDDISVLEEN